MRDLIKNLITLRVSDGYKNVPIIYKVVKELTTKKADTRTRTRTT